MKLRSTAVAFVLTMTSILGCRHADNVQPFDFAPFVVSDSSQDSDALPKSEAVPEVRADIVVAGVTALQFVEVFASTYGVGLVVQSDLTGSEITGQWIGATASEVAQSAGKSLSVEATLVGDTWFLGKFGKDDRGVAVVPVYGMVPEDALTIARSLASETGSQHVTTDGLMVVADAESVLRRILSAVAEVREKLDGKRGYMVQLVFLRLDETAQKSAGIDGRVGVDIGEVFTGKTADLLTVGAVSAYIEYVVANGRGRVDASPVLRCLEGVESRIVDGETVPIIQRAVSSEGTVTDTGFNEVQVGFRCGVLVRGLGERARVTVDFESSAVVELVGEVLAPRVARTALTVSGSVPYGERVLLGEIVAGSDRKGKSGFLSRSDAGRSRVQVFCKVGRL